MKALSDYVFAPNAYDLPSDLVAYMQYQRRGFNGGNEDPKIHERVLNVQRGVLAHILSTSVTKRMTDIQLIGNTYTLNEMMKELTDAIFKADVTSNVNSYRQNLQIEYTKKLIEIISTSTYSYQSQSNALAQLKSIKTMMATGLGNADTKAHRDHIVFAINKALEK
jgi:hypothetical protein